MPSPKPACRVIKPPVMYFKPADDTGRSIFTGGTIDVGQSEHWQEGFIDAVSDHFSIAYNPRRIEWDHRWTQSIDDPQFNVQVNWELQAIEHADIVFMHFEAVSKSPISLLELGIVSQMKPESTVVSCPKDFYRRGNVEIVCNRYGIVLLNGLQDSIDYFSAKYRK